MSKVWAGVGAWALDAERAEAEERERAEAAAASVFSSGHSALLSGDPSQSFPSLKEAATKPKKKKAVSLKISEFTSGAYICPGGALRQSALEPKGLTHDEMLRLPTGPRERTAEELGNTRLGGGFRAYGYGGSRAAASLRRRPEFGVEDGTRMDSPRTSDLNLPSRADEVDNWASSKKFVPIINSVRQERYGSLGSGGLSKADEVEDWSLGKKSVAPLPPPNKFSGFGSGFSDSPILGSDSDRWIRGGRGSLSSNGEQRRPRLVLDPPKKGDSFVSRTEPARTRPSPFGSARPREEVLSDKGLDWRKMETEIEMKRSLRPSSSQSSRPSSAHSSRAESLASQVSGEGAIPKTGPKVNPFGNAKPREVLLEEKGMDWRKIDMELEHRRVERPETEEEKSLKEEIDHLKKELAEESKRKIDCDSEPNSTEHINSLHWQLSSREEKLYRLICELDDKVRFGKRAAIDVRPGSGSGRISIHADRPRSQSSISNDSRNMDFTERPSSRGKVDSWSRPMDEQCGIHRSRDSVLLLSRSGGRPKSRESR